MAPPVPASTAMPAFAETPDERARMGRISGVLWILAAVITVASCYLPGAQHVAIGWVYALSGLFFLYGLASALGWLRWDRASMKTLCIGMVLTISVIGLGIYFTGGAMSFVQPMLVTTLLYAAFFFPAQWAWPLSIELILVAGTPIVYDGNAIEEAFLPHYVALVAGFLSATWVLVGLRKRLLEAELHQRDIAHRDPLTGVANRRRLEEVLDVEWRRAEGSGEPIAMAMIDIDRFKWYNDRYGHTAGDQCLRRVARHLCGHVRGTDVVARYGGEEFAIVMPGTDIASAVRIVERLRHRIGALAEPHLSADERIVTVSIGVAAATPFAGGRWQQLVEQSDIELYNAKRAGRNQVRPIV
jgi:diguanylate cyclase (GGDEF)-like protein